MPEPVYDACPCCGGELVTTETPFAVKQKCVACGYTLIEPKQQQ